MASMIAAVRGLAAGNATIMHAGPRRTAWVGVRKGFNTAGVQGVWRTIPKRTIKHCSNTSSANATVRQKTAGAHTRSKKSPLTILQQIRTRLFHTTRIRRSAPKVEAKPTSSTPTEDLSLGQRMRKLSREYGWSALGVYLTLSALDFPFCYLLVRYLGTDRIGEWEHVIVSNVERLIPESVKSTWHEWRQSVKLAEREFTGGETVHEHVEMAGWGVEEAQERNKKDASLATQLALAYAIHKSFIFIRVPLAAAITPKVVKILRGWGWDIGKRTTKEAKAIKRAAKS